MNKIFITGIDGFIGKALCNFFSKKNYIIFGLTRLNKNDFIKSNFNPVFGDLLENNFKIPDVDFCIHTAAISPTHSNSNLDFFTNNSVGTINLLKCLQNTNCKKIFYTSSISIYGENRKSSVNEKTDIINPDGYGLSKLIGEKILFSQKDISIISLRLPGVQGPGASRTWLSKTIEKAIKNKLILISNPDGLFNNAVWINDIANFIEEKLILEKFEKSNFVLGSSNPMKIKDIIKLIKFKTHSRSTIKYEIGKTSFHLEIDKALKEGFMPSSLNEIINKQISANMEQQNNVN